MTGRWFALALGVAFVGAAAGAATAQPTESIDRWNTDAVVSALQAVRATEVRPVTGAGPAAITARTRDGLNVGVYARACDPAPPGVESVCRGLEAVISFDPGPRADRRALVNQLNHQYALAKFLDEPDGTIRLSRYVVLEGAVSPGNLRAELSSLFAIGALTEQTLWPNAAKR